MLLAPLHNDRKSSPVHFDLPAVMVSLDRQTDIPGNSLLQTQIIYLTTCNIIILTKERFMNNTMYYQTMLSLLLNFSHH